tara:strand:- start:76 stop:348 length:273 start_codon:yes stop_codon:yes gene_type:complete
MKKAPFKLNSPLKNGRPTKKFKKIKQLIPFSGKGPASLATSTAAGAGLGVLASRIFPKAFTPAAGAIVGGGIGAQIDFMRQTKSTKKKKR